MYFQAYTTCAIGVHYVGFLATTFAVTSAIAGYISGQLHQYVGRIALLLAGQFRVNDLRIVFLLTSERGQLDSVADMFLELILVAKSLKMNYVCQKIGPIRPTDKKPSCR